MIHITNPRSDIYVWLALESNDGGPNVGGYNGNSGGYNGNSGGGFGGDSRFR